MVAFTDMPVVALEQLPVAIFISCTVCLRIQIGNWIRNAIAVHFVEILMSSFLREDKVRAGPGITD